MRMTHVFVPLALGFGLGFPWLGLTSCAKFVIADRTKKAAPAQEPTAPPQRKEAGPAVPSSPTPPERIIRLTVAQVQPESWWNTCLFLSVNGAPDVQVGCGKDAAQIGKVIELPAKKDFCNQLKVRMKVTTGCPAPRTCDITSWERISTVAADKSYFKFVEGTKMFPANPDIRPEASVAAGLEATTKEADTYVKAQVGNTWLRTWFEDQTEKNFALWGEDKAKWRERGIDFNDYVIDLKGENVAFTVEGSGIPCGSLTPAAEPAAEPAAQPAVPPT